MTKQIYNATECGVSQHQVNPDALTVIKKLHKYEFDAYIVGGGVRDLLLGKTPKDFDIVTNATPEMVRKIFKRNAIIIGRRFKIVHVTFDNLNPDKLIHNRPMIEKNVIEISTYRSDKVHTHSLNQFGKIMEDNNYGTQDEDATRRDFTVNALYYDPIAEIIIDYHNGMDDIKKRSLGMIGDPLSRYHEDPVRILRAIRLSVKLDLTIEYATDVAIQETKQLLAHEHKWRLYEEMLKFLLSGHSSSCIKKLQEIELPHNVFVLFDRLFFGKHPDQLAIRILEKTDARLQETSDVSVVFILAGLMWNFVFNLWQKYVSDGRSAYQALSDAIAVQKNSAFNLCVPKYAYNCMRDVWILQLDFENPTVKRVHSMLNSSRFRQGWHLFSTRHDLGLVESAIFNWWDEFIPADDDARVTLLDQLTEICENINTKKTTSKAKVGKTVKTKKPRKKIVKTAKPAKSVKKTGSTADGATEITTASPISPDSGIDKSTIKIIK
jgi:poly(A) polymerase